MPFGSHELGWVVWIGAESSGSGLADATRHGLFAAARLFGTGRLFGDAQGCFAMRTAVFA
ncbi:MAG: hypothetical protein AB8E87_02695 [Prochlorococcus sp.]